MNVATNVLLVCLTAGRIWWIKREAQSLLGTSSPARYTAVVPMILESGSIYCLCLVLQVVAQSLRPSNASSIFLGVSTGLAEQVVNIAPTLLVVRAGLDPDRNRNTRSRVDIVASGVVFRSTPMDTLSSPLPTGDSSPGIETKRTSLEIFEP